MNSPERIPVETRKPLTGYLWVNLNKRQKCPITFRAEARPELLLSCPFMPSAAHP